MTPTNELIIEDSSGHRKLLSPTRFFIGWDEAEQWVQETYRGYKLVGIQEGLFGGIRENPRQS